MPSEEHGFHVDRVLQAPAGDLRVSVAVAFTDAEVAELPGSLQAARAFAVKHHGEQTYGPDLPYVAHLDEVLRVTAEYRLPWAEQVAAYLHDLVEDTPCTVDDIAAEFGGIPAMLVDALTRDGGEPAEPYYRRIAYVGLHAARVKVADRIANLTASLRLFPFDPINASHYLTKYLGEREAFDAMRPLVWDSKVGAAMWGALDVLYTLAERPGQVSDTLHRQRWHVPGLTLK
jgi:hypothetical protein